MQMTNPTCADNINGYWLGDTSIRLVVSVSIEVGPSTAN